MKVCLRLGDSILILQCCRKSSFKMNLLLLCDSKSTEKRGSRSMLTLCLTFMMFLTLCPFLFNSSDVSDRYRVVQATNDYSVSSVLLYLVCVMNDACFPNVMDWFSICIGCVWSDFDCVVGKGCSFLFDYLKEIVYHRFLVVRIVNVYSR